MFHARVGTHVRASCAAWTHLCFDLLMSPDPYVPVHNSLKRFSCIRVRNGRNKEPCTQETKDRRLSKPSQSVPSLALRPWLGSGCSFAIVSLVKFFGVPYAIL